MIKRKKPIRRCSSKRAAQLKEYSKLRAEYLILHPFCQVWMDEVWEKMPQDARTAASADRATDIHHRKKRYGKMLLDTRYWMAVSRTAHKRIHAFPKWAREKGYLLDK